MRVRLLLQAGLLIMTTGACMAVLPTPELSSLPPPPVTSPLSATATPELPLPPGVASEFETDFSQHSVPFEEIVSGGPSKDVIPAIDEPAFVGIARADEWLAAHEAVIVVQMGEEARAYPVQIMLWHEIVNDTVNGVPLAVTFCPLCNTAIVFERTVDGRVLDFGTTGRLRYSNLIMYDRQTESWWQQATGEAIVGELTGHRLVFRSAAIVSWGAFKAAHPEGRVLSRDTEHRRDYGRNPYPAYDRREEPLLYEGPETPDALPVMARVLGVGLNGPQAVAYAYPALRDLRVVNDTLGGRPVVVLWEPGTVSPLDGTRVRGGRDVGAAAAYERSVEGDVLHFAFEGGRIIDRQTESHWNVLGQAMSGPLEGRQLQPLASANYFWFAWAAFWPQSTVVLP